MNDGVILAFAAASVSGMLTMMFAWYERRSVAHFFFVIGMAVLTVESIFAGLALSSALTEEMVRWQNWRLIAMSFLPATWLFFSLSYARGNYLEFLKRWRLLLIAALLVPSAICLVVQGGFITKVSKSAAGEMIFGLGLSGVFLNFLFLVGAVLTLMNLERTFRASVGTMRWRIKYMIVGLGILFAVRAYTSTQILLFHAVNPALQTVDSVALLVGCLLILRSLFRAGHFDVDVYPSHAVLQNSLTILLAGIYLLVIGAFAKLVTFWGGDAAFTLKAFVVLLAVVFLTTFLLSDRARLHTSRFVSRHFQRPLYDYRNVWRRFTEGTVSCVNQTELCQEAVKLLAEVFQVLSVTIWLVDEKKEQLLFAASTFLTEEQADLLSRQNQTGAQLIQALQKHQDPVDIDDSSEPWAIALRLCHPDEFRKGGNRICVPMIVGGEIVGLMILGDRVSGVAFSWQDFDLLKCVSDQIAANLLNARLSQKLLQTKELEAFQTMSAFFVHDLKNAASTLNLLLQNLPIHFDDPAFRADALRGTAKTVAHINHLIERLSHLRHELKIKPVEADLNTIINQSVADLEKTTGFNLIKTLGVLPPVAVDQEQIGKVIVNLVLNARESLSSDGKILIETKAENNSVLLSVSDNGCGISPDFLKRSLFRPFQTTKKNGLGIGMFQSKMIVEAHRGKMEVESEQGKGTTFRIYLPIKS